jgi:hypothetical protein
MNFVHWLLARMKEPSTYAGLSGLTVALGISTHMYEAAAAAIAGIAGLVAVILAEKAKPE